MKGRYNEESGLLTWKKRPVSHFKNLRGLNVFNNLYAGKIAGTITEQGYVRVWLNGKAHCAHRLIWILMTGEQPNIIDHIDRNPTNNVWMNLRSVTHSLNHLNAKCHKNNRIGVKGISYDKQSKRYRVRVNIGGISHYFGRYNSLKQAQKVYQDKCKALQILT